MTTGQLKQILLLLATTSLLFEQSLSFVIFKQPSRSVLVMDMSAGGNKKRRRRKETPTGSTALDPIKLEKEKVEGTSGLDEDDELSRNTIRTDEGTLFELKPDDIAKGSLKSEESTDFLQDIEEVAKFNFQNRDDILKGIGNEERPVQSSTPSVDAAIPLPDIKEARQKKLMEEELARMEEEKENAKPKIKRSDRAAFMKLLEQQPFSDADDSLFEEEEYTTISALLGERSAKFIGIPAGPIQVGHFIGALGILLMAFVEYPGFPLTNLPSPLRGALQGGLGVVYGINTVLAVAAAFQARQRGQPIPLWVAKTLAVGGLAYDQLTQLPTLEAIEKAKSVKGARAIKKR